LLQALGLHQLVVGAQPFQALAQLVLDLLHGVENGLARGRVVGLREDGVAGHLVLELAGEGIEQRQRLHLVVEQLHPQGLFVGLRRVDVDDVAAHPIAAAAQLDLVAAVLQRRQPPQDGALIDALAAGEMQHHLQVGFRVSQAVDAGDRGHQNHVRALQQGLGGGQAHLLDVLVDGRVLLDVGVGGRHIGLGLVVVVVADEVLHRVVREELAHLAVELGGEGLVGRQDQGGALHLLDDVGDGEGLAGAGDAEQRHAGLAVAQALHQLADGGGLVTGGWKLGGELERLGHDAVVRAGDGGPDGCQGPGSLTIIRAAFDTCQAAGRQGADRSTHASPAPRSQGRNTSTRSRTPNNPMTIKLSARVQAVKPSATLAITARAAELKAAGKDVIGLGAGEPDFDTPHHIKQAAIEAINAGFTKYTAVDGTPALKRAIIAKFQRDNGLDYQPAQILVSCGGKQSFFNLAQALLDPGDEVVIPAPYWVSYPDMVLLAGATPVIVNAGADQRFKITAAQLRGVMSERTRLVVINSPSNPTGMAYSKDELAALGEVLRDYPDALIATDDMYEHIRWDTATPFVNILNACPDLTDRTLVLNGVSKAYSMTGWRIGYAGGPADIIKAMKKIQSQSTSNPTSISQVAAQAALEGPQACIGEMLTAFKARHDFVVEALNAVPGVDCLPTDGTFYVFPEVSGLIDRLSGVSNDLELAEYLIEQAGVALVPGSAFGLDGCVRISIATSRDNLEQAMARIAAVAG